MRSWRSAIRWFTALSDSSTLRTLYFTVPILLHSMGLPAWTGVIAAIVICALVGVVVELVAYRPVRRKGTSMSALITAIAMSLLLENLAQAIPAMGPNPRVISDEIFSTAPISIGGVSVNMAAVVTIIIAAIVMAALQLFVQKTKLGAVSENKEASTLVGINVNRTIVTTFAIGSGLAAVAALMYCAQYHTVTTTMGSMLGLKAFVAAVMGGIGLIPGAMLGGIVVGIIEALVTAYISSSLANAVVFLILIVMLLVKPAGILGKNVGEKV